MNRHSPLRLETSSCTLCGAEEGEPCASGTDFEYDTTDETFYFLSCRQCGHQYLNPRPATSELDRIYPAHYYSFTDTTHALVARFQKIWESRKVRLYRNFIGEGERQILDVGCGDGRLLKLLRDFGHPDWKIAGLEFDEKAIRHCQEMGFEAHAARVEDFSRDESQQERFDAVIMLQLIEHVDDPSMMCERVHTLLKENGVFIIETPNLAGLDYRLFSGRWWGHYHFPRHWNLFSRERLEQMLMQHDFEPLAHENLISTSAWIISFHNFFKDRGWPDFVWRFFSYQNPLLLALAISIDTVRIRAGKETSNQRLIARKRTKAPE
ncbi:MAG: methyltransferase domain-containing protein [Myxococcota bacterium]|nr:methyltransferase domain-containing protein [Myxococcota bacterium]